MKEEMLHDATKIRRILRDYREQLHANELDDPECTSSRDNIVPITILFVHLKFVESKSHVKCFYYNN